MNYTYLASQFCDPNINASDIFSDLKDGQLHYICYHVTTNGKYPFVQIMLELLHDCFVLPSITIDNYFTNKNIETLIFRKIKTDLKGIRCNLVIPEYKGILKVNIESNKQNVYALIDVSSVDINCLNLSKMITTWFALPTEIINLNSICNIPVSNNVSNLFQNVMPELGVLMNNGSPYLLPDVVYTSSSDLKETEFRSLFGPSKIKNLFHFCTSILPSENNNRYALFIENPILKAELDLDLYQDIDYQDDLCILDNNTVLVTEYESFIPLSFHITQL
jgi:hypothetical protein